MGSTKVLFSGPSFLLLKIWGSCMSLESASLFELVDMWQHLHGLLIVFWGLKPNKLAHNFWPIAPSFPLFVLVNWWLRVLQGVSLENGLAFFLDVVSSCVDYVAPSCMLWSWYFTKKFHIFWWCFLFKHIPLMATRVFFQHRPFT